jgi:hemoglobin
MHRQTPLLLSALLIAAAAAVTHPAWSQTPAPAWALPGEEKVDPYSVSNANAGATPVNDVRLFDAFHGKAGLDRISADLVDRSERDARISDIFKTTDSVRLKRTLSEQFCYILAGPCAYTGRDMAAAHKDMGLAGADMNALVENLQLAMDKEGVPFSAQNRLLAKLAPMKREMMQRPSRR